MKRLIAWGGKKKAMSFADRLRELREKAGMTQEALAQACGMSVGSVRNYEQGIREPYWRGAFQLATTLGVDCRVFADCVDQPELPVKKGRKK
jgi:transcriptional regulator with XRE-family HTH domain